MGTRNALYPRGLPIGLRLHRWSHEQAASIVQPLNLAVECGLARRMFALRNAASSLPVGLREHARLARHEDFPVRCDR